MDDKAEFEAAYIKLRPDADIRQARFSDEYRDRHTAVAYQLWSQRRPTVNLPAFEELKCLFRDAPMKELARQNGYERAIKDCTKAIQAVGLEVSRG
jgi:hypothetical protein